MLRLIVAGFPRLHGYHLEDKLEYRSARKTRSRA
jgi:hypothetical protein